MTGSAVGRFGVGPHVVGRDNGSLWRPSEHGRETQP
jgi:hypothetical protein